MRDNQLTDLSKAIKKTAGLDILGPLRLSPLNLLGSRLATLPFVKNLMCSYEMLGWPSYRNLGFCDRDLSNQDENFPI